LDPPDPLIEYVGAQLGTSDAVVAASVAFQGVTSRLAAAVLTANESLGVAVDAPFVDVRWRASDTGLRLGLAELRTGPSRPWADAVAQLVAEAFVPWVDCVRRHVRIGERLLWGNAAASLLTLAQQLGADRAAALSALPLNGLAELDPTSYRRTTCCLIERAPGYGRCGECSLNPRTRVR
jgi:ferric iron reductase protein FhuF